MTLRGTARAADISPSLLSLVEQEKHIPSKKVLVRLAAVLDGDVDVWFGLAGKVTPAVEASLSQVAKEDPQFFRKMLGAMERSDR